jgi:hypothetical protein
MRERFDRDVSFVVDCITKGNENGIRDDEALERSIACLAVAMENEAPGAEVGIFASFKYIAAAVCLKEVERFQGWSSTFGIDF